MITYKVTKCRNPKNPDVDYFKGTAMQAHNRAGDEEGCSSGGSQPSKQLCHAEGGEEDDGVAERTTDEHGDIGGKGMRAHDA